MLLLAHLCVPLPAHAGLLDALFSPTYNEFRRLIDAGDKEAAALFLAREADYFDKLEGDKRAQVDAFRQAYFLDQLTAFVTAERDTEALALLSAQIERFRTLPAEAGIRYQALLNTLDLRQAARLQRLMIELDEADQTPAPMKRWSLLKAALASAPIKYPVKLEKAESIRTLLDTRRQTIIDKLNAEAGEAMASYGWFSQPAFTEVYPVKPDLARLMGDGTLLLAQLEGASAAQIKRFAQMYRSAMPAELKQKVAASYVRKLASERGAKSYLDKRTLVDEAKRDGLDAGNGSILFAASPLPENFRRLVTLQAPTAVRLTELGVNQTPGDFLATAEARQHDLIVFLRFQEPMTERSEKSRQTLSSRFQSGTRTVSNPRYAEAVEEVAQAERTLAAAERARARSNKADSSGLGVAIAVLGAMTDSAARSSLDSARQNLANTPRTLQERVFTPYSYTR
ncbi:MAG TPA: hypothetical protein VLK85_30175, partial [Ramlibacter sp.]|nr:hypothetical protein [Ramlibacter sp.]